MGASLGNDDDIPPRELVHFVTQQTRFALINNILQHPDQLPSTYELEELENEINSLSSIQ